jgi:hypothetical protein
MNLTLVYVIIIYIFFIALYIYIEHIKDPGWKLVNGPNNTLIVEEDKDPIWYTPSITVILTVLAIITTSLGDFLGNSYTIEQMEYNRRKGDPTIAPAPLSSKYSFSNIINQIRKKSNAISSSG